MGELDDHLITALTLEAKDCGASLDAGRIDHGGRRPPDGDPRQRLLAGVQHVGAG